MDASLHVVAEDHAADLRRLLEGIARHVADGGWEILVVDNAATFDVSAHIPEALRSAVGLLTSRRRLGWADAVNLGMQRSRARLAILVDCSVEPTGDFLAPLLATVDADQGIGLAGPWGLTSANGRQFEETQSGEVDAVQAYCLAVRREILRDIGLFDPHYTFHRNADLDFSFAARAAGWRAVQVDLPLQRHEHRRYAALATPERDRLSKRNFYRFLKRWGDRRDLLLRPSSEPPHHH
jgi:GT2 family glycosyltransferase